MHKLQRMKNNIALFQAQRRLCALKQVAEVFRPPAPSTDNYVDQIMSPPRDLVQLYFAELAVFIDERIAGDAMHTQEQHRCMMEDHLMSVWRNQQATGMVSGMINRSSYWKPRVELRNGIFAAYLGDTLICSNSN